MNVFLIISAWSGLLCVALGAFGSHFLKAKLSGEQLNVFHTGVEYQFYHTFALALVGVLWARHPNASLLPLSGWSFFLGMVLFSGSLYALAATRVKAIGMVTPVGGTLFLVAWFLLAVAALRVNKG